MGNRVVMTLKEAAEYLNVHCDTLRRRAKNGTIPAFKIGTDWRFYQSSIDSWIKEMEEAHRMSVNNKRPEKERRKDVSYASNSQDTHR